MGLLRDEVNRWKKFVDFENLAPDIQGPMLRAYICGMSACGAIFAEGIKRAGMPQPAISLELMTEIPELLASIIRKEAHHDDS